MRVILSMITGIAALGMASGLDAQQKKAEPKKPAPERENCFTWDGKTECSLLRTRVDSASMKRAAIGVQLSPTGTSRDTLGVFISRVTPKGPAENAGIVEGDRIISINGVDLRVNAADAGDSYAAGLPSRRLTREVAKLSPGAVVNLRVWSGGRARDVQVTTGRASDLNEGGFYGLFEGGSPGAVFRTMPRMENMKVPLEQLRSFERMRAPIERLRMSEIPRMRFEDFDGLPRMRIEGLPKLREGEGKIRIYSPRFGDGQYRTYIIGPDGELKLDKSEPSKKDKESADKAKKDADKK